MIKDGMAVRNRETVAGGRKSEPQNEILLRRKEEWVMYMRTYV